MFKKILLFVFSAFLLVNFANAEDFTQHKSLVIYYSLYENRIPLPQNDEVLAKGSGNAQNIANLVADLTNADVFSLHVVKKYPSTYEEVLDVGRKELDEDARPAIVDVPNVANYDTVILVYPNWWGSYPRAVATMLDKVDLSGKNIVPIVTHEGSKLGRSVQDLKAKLPNSNIVKDCLDIPSKNAHDADLKDKLASYLSSLEF